MLSALLESRSEFLIGFAITDFAQAFFLLPSAPAFLAVVATSCVIYLSPPGSSSRSIDALPLLVFIVGLQTATVGGGSFMGGKEHDVLPAIEAGATGYLLKDAPRDELVRAVRAAFRGEPVLSPCVAGRLMGRVRQPPRDELSQRELKVLRLVAGGAANREAAARLFVSEATIKTHLLHIYGKLGVRDRAASVGDAYRRKLLS